MNRSETTRYMLKIRVQPTQPQVLQWNTDDFDATTMAPRHIFDPTYLPALDGNDVRSILMQLEPWYEFDTGRLELINRIHLWRYLIGDASADVDYWATRVENDPGRA